MKRIVVTDLGLTDGAGYLRRRTAVDLLHIADPRGVATPARPGEYGVGPEFSFPLVSVETVLPVGMERLLLASDNNFPFNDGRVTGRAGDTELIVISAPSLTRTP